MIVWWIIVNFNHVWVGRNWRPNLFSCSFSDHTFNVIPNQHKICNRLIYYIIKRVYSYILTFNCYGLLMLMIQEKLICKELCLSNFLPLLCTDSIVKILFKILGLSPSEPYWIFKPTKYDDQEGPNLMPSHIFIRGNRLLVLSNTLKFWNGQKSYSKPS